MRIIERLQERNGSWTVRIANTDETRSAFLNFQTEPTDAEVRAAFQIMLDSEHAVQAAQDAERTAEESSKVTLRDAIMRYEAGQLTNAQSKALLDKIIGRLRKYGLV